MPGGDGIAEPIRMDAFNLLDTISLAQQPGQIERQKRRPDSTSMGRYRDIRFFNNEVLHPLKIRPTWNSRINYFIGQPKPKSETQERTSVALWTTSSCAFEILNFVIGMYS